MNKGTGWCSIRAACVCYVQCGRTTNGGTCTYVHIYPSIACSLPSVGGNNSLCEMKCLAFPCCGQQVVGTHWESDWLLAVATLKCYLGVGREAFCLGLQGWDGGEGRYGNKDIVD